MLRGQNAHARAVRRVRAPARPAAAARDRPVPPSRDSEHPDPVQREEGRQADRACRTPARTSTPTTRTCRCRRARRRSTRSSCRRVGGDTLFANQQAAYDDLPEAMKKRIEPLYGIHHYGNRHDTDERSRTAASPLTDEQKAKMPLITHRIARPHPVTGRKSLYAVYGSSFGIVGMPDDEALDLLDELAAHSTQPKYQYCAQVRRRRRRDLGQRVAPALGDADRSGRRAHAVADHRAGAGAGRHGAAGDRADLRARRNVASLSAERLILARLADSPRVRLHCKHPS